MRYRVFYNRSIDYPNVWSFDDGNIANEIIVKALHGAKFDSDTNYKADNTKEPRAWFWTEADRVFINENQEAFFIIDLKLRKKRQRSVVAVSKRRRKLRQQIVEYLGGKCSKCGYDKCAWALDAHHIDSSTKEFGLSHKGLTRSWEKIKEEADKCQLLCANCHREEHASQ